METSGSVRLRVPIAASLSGLRGGRGRRFPQRSVPNPLSGQFKIGFTPSRIFQRYDRGGQRERFSAGIQPEMCWTVSRSCRQLPLREFCYLRVRRRISKIAGENYFCFFVYEFRSTKWSKLILMVFTSMQIGRFGWKWQLSLLELKLTIIISYI